MRLLENQIVTCDAYSSGTTDEVVAYTCPVGKFASILPGGRFIYTHSGDFGRLRIYRDYAGTPELLVEITSTQYAVIGSQWRLLDGLAQWSLMPGDAIVIVNDDDDPASVTYLELLVEEYAQ